MILSTVGKTFIRHQILLDDTENEDILIHLLPSIHFIQAELEKGRGVLVHCQAGVSRSATIVTAYLMYSRNMDTTTALELIRRSRPYVEPNQNFLRQLELFHRAHFKISPRDKAIRMFYMDRAVEEVMNGDGSLPDTGMFAKYPRTPTGSVPSTPGGPRRRIRCKMCRTELATREHMLDHGQLGAATPAAGTPAVSRRPSTSQPISRQSSTSQSRSRLGSSHEPPLRRPSMLSQNLEPQTLASAEEEQIEQEDGEPILTTSINQPGSLATRRGSAGHSLSLHNLRSMSNTMTTALSMSALETEDDEEGQGGPTPQLTPSINDDQALHSSIETARLLGRRLSEAMISSNVDVQTPIAEVPPSVEDGTVPAETIQDTVPSIPLTESPRSPSAFSSPHDLATQLYANPKLAALRSTPTTTPVPHGNRPIPPLISPGVSPPILANPKCSGYFVEPMKWMESFLESGQLAGKIICPNKKCGAKLGNLDWAGMRCGCNEWVTPAFCISRSKVDEVV
ncbi:hypothetical protein BDQ12DRAFT_689589 [Crucibulum laeve]|uniref:protein-tyrosine-phosphatase n=1 Tax=Crucibulum laeve TaxID=68775 RepID=A0A5C3M0B0_9AGAR|nr:hypothetical protein BDQ12DRAFT_689589 [Crucibulum laeve]